MLKLKRRTVLDRVNGSSIDMEISTPQPTATLPPKEYERSFGADFNLILAVKEEGPKRIEAIDKELAKINARIASLNDERKQLTALVTALS